MGQSKIPATCADCKVVGPPRTRAEKAGWWRRQILHELSPDWLCPSCAPAAKEELRKEQEAEQKAWLERMRKRRVLFEFQRQARISRTMTITKIFVRCESKSATRWLK